MGTQIPENNGPDLDADDNVNPESQGQEQEQEVNLNPAWNPLLEILPEEFHKLSAPILQSWDKNYQEKVNGLQADLDQYSDWAEFVENDVDPEQTKAALMFAVRLEEDPKGTIEGLAKHFGIDLSGSAQGTKTTAKDNTDDDDEFDLDDLPSDLAEHPVIKQLVESQQALNEQLQSRENESVVQQLEEQLDEYLEELHEEYGDFHEPFVLAMFQNGYEMEDAVQYFQSSFPGWKDTSEDEEEAQAPANQSSGFVPMGSGGTNVGGGVPVNPSQNYGKLGNGEITDLVAKLAAGMDDKNS